MSSSQGTRDVVTTRTMTETPTPSGGKTVTEETRTHEESSTESKSGVDPAQVQSMISAALSAALSTTGLGGLNWGGVIGSGVAAIGGGVALIKNAEAKRNRLDAERHRADSDEAWDKLVAAKGKSDVG